MYQPYFDITSRLGKPLWWDENGVPRYEPFEPRMCADIYHLYCALVEIECQACSQKFNVACSWSITANLNDVKWDENGRNPQPAGGFPTPEDEGFCSYGDAPFHPEEGQCSGTTMMCDLVRVLEFWKRDGPEDKRLPEYEVRFYRDAA